MTTQPPGHQMRFDYSRSSTVATCQCGWRDIASGRDAAHAMAAAHQHRMDQRLGKPLRYHGPQHWDHR